MEINTNLITGKYVIDRTQGRMILVREVESNRVCKFDYTNEKTKIEDCYIARIEPFDPCNSEQAYIQYTDVNGISSEVVLTQDDFNEVVDYVKLSHNYCVFRMSHSETSGDSFFAYVDLENAFSE